MRIKTALYNQCLIDFGYIAIIFQYSLSFSISERNLSQLTKNPIKNLSSNLLRSLELVLMVNFVLVGIKFFPNEWNKLYVDTDVF